MGRRMIGLVAIFGVFAAMALMTAPPVSAQAITCAPGTTTLVRAVGSQTAPMLVPAQVHATICSQNGSVVAVLPAFQTVGPSGAPLIVPSNLNIRTCVPASVVTTPTVGSGLTAPALVQVSPGVFAISPGAAIVPGTPVIVGSTVTALSCF